MLMMSTSTLQCMETLFMQDLPTELNPYFIMGAGVVGPSDRVLGAPRVAHARRERERERERESDVVEAGGRPDG